MARIVSNKSLYLLRVLAIKRRIQHKKAPRRYPRKMKMIMMKRQLMRLSQMTSTMKLMMISRAVRKTVQESIGEQSPIKIISCPKNKIRPLKMDSKILLLLPVREGQA